MIKEFFIRIFFRFIYFLATLDTNSLRWVFGSAAQSLAALMAFLIAGYNFVYERLEGEEDESLSKINEKIQEKYYFKLKFFLF